MTGFQRRLTHVRLLFGAFRAGVIGPWSAVRLYQAADFRLPPDEMDQR
jgi:hypothetical protein